MPRPELKLATFNLYNLQLPGLPMYHGNTYTQKQYDGKIEWTAEVLKRIDADVIGFQELWNPKALNDAFKAAGLANDYTLAAKLFPNSISTALAVRKGLWSAIIPSALRIKHLALAPTQGREAGAGRRLRPARLRRRRAFCAGRGRPAQLSCRTPAAGSLRLAAPARAPDQKRSFPHLSEDD